MAYGKVEDVLEAYIASGGITINWSVKDCGFGQTIITSDKDSNTKMDTEGLNKEAIKAILCKLIDDAEIVD